MMNFLKHKLYLTFILPLLILLSLGCGKPNSLSFIPINNFTNSNSIYKVNNVSNDELSIVEASLDPQQPKNKQEFLVCLKKQGINLTDKELQTIQNFTKLKASGKWTPGPMNDPRQNLEHHFKKHGQEFKPVPQNADEYFERAKNFINRYDSNTCYFFDTRYFNQGQLSVVKWDKETKEFSAARINGDIATYFIDITVNYPRFIYIPRDMHLQHKNPPSLTLKP